MDFKNILSSTKKKFSSASRELKIAGLTAGIGVLTPVSSFAQDYGAGVTALDGVTTGLQAYLPAVIKVCYALAGIVAIIGAISVYIAMNNEEQDVKKKIMMTVGACIFLIAAAQALPAFFGLSVK